MSQSEVSWTEEEESPGVIVRDDGNSRTEFRHSESATNALREVFGTGLFAAYCKGDSVPCWDGGALGEVVLVLVDTSEYTHVPRGQAHFWPVLLRGSAERIPEGQGSKRKGKGE